MRRTTFLLRVCLRRRMARLSAASRSRTSKTFAALGAWHSHSSDNIEPLPGKLWPEFEQYLADDSLPWTIRTLCKPSNVSHASKVVAQHHAVHLPCYLCGSRGGLQHQT